MTTLRSYIEGLLDSLHDHDDETCCTCVGQCTCNVVSGAGQTDYLRASRFNMLRDLIEEAEGWEREEREAGEDSGLVAKILELQQLVEGMLTEAFPDGRPPRDGIPRAGVSAPPEGE